jgi:hypothetical protein
VTREIGAIWMKCRRCLLLFLVLAAVLPFTTDYAYGANQLSVSVSTDKPSYDPGDAVLISGSVLDQSLNGVDLASVSIQVNDPNGNAIHVGWILSTTDGYYEDQFIAQDNSMNGGYSIYVTASKPGYEDATAQAGCIITPEFQESHVQWSMLLPTLLLVFLVGKRERSSINGSTLEEEKCRAEGEQSLG